MPIFEYICRECHQQFETIVLGKQQPKCPKCKSRRLEQQISKFAVAGEKSADETPGACGTCGDPRGPGSCSIN